MKLGRYEIHPAPGGDGWLDYLRPPVFWARPASGTYRWVLVVGLVEIRRRAW